MYIKAISNKIVENPYSIQKLKQDNPHVSFTNTIEIDYPTLAEYNVYRVFPTAKPECNLNTHRAELSKPVFKNGKWNESWKVVELSSEEKEIVLNSKRDEALALRKRLLIESDWTQYKDVDDNISKKWTPYRQALRDITSQKNFPLDVQWPDMP